jgi:ELWxxDGT repeat protein
MEVHADSTPARFRGRSSDVVFTALYASRLFRTDGTAAGTAPLQRNGRFAFVRTELASLPDGEVLFAAPDDDSNAFLWRTTPESFELVLGFSWYFSTIAGTEIFRLDSSQYLFPVRHGEDSSELWRTDGTVAGTSHVHDFVSSNFYYAIPRDFVSTGGRAWFAAADDVHGYELWESDGTPKGTIVHEQTPGPEPTYDRPSRLTPVPLSDGSSLFYVLGDELWRSNTQTQAANLVRVLKTDFPPGELRFALGAANQRALFFDLVPGGGCALFASDGSREGTVPLLDIGAGARGTGTCPEELVRYRGVHYFTACGPSSGCELWRTDGTPAGTTQLLEIEPGLISSSPSSLTAIGGFLYFSACTTEHGCEPWRSDGTAVGTQRLGDLNPGPASSTPTGFAGAHGDVYFAADGGTGSEPWVFEPEPLFADGFESGDTSRWGVPLRRARHESSVAWW